MSLDADSRAAKISQTWLRQLFKEQATLADKYEYGPLDSRRHEIRLFELLPSKKKNAPVEGHLRTVSLDDKPRFEALSYVWGDPRPRRKVFVHGDSRRTLLVAKNLARALPDIRSQDKSIIIWIDGLCINQADFNERASQVQLMR